MAASSHITPASIRQRRSDNPKMRDRDLADALGVSEAALVAAHVGQSGPRRAWRIDPDPDRTMPAAEGFGEVMALTRNLSAVHEKVGRYGDYHPGKHAAMVLSEAIDLRIFPGQWRHGFLVETETEGGMRRSMQIFDGAGDAVHKIFLRDGSDLSAWQAAKSGLLIADQSERIEVEPRVAPDGARRNPDKLDILRAEWRKMTDTHQFQRLVSKLKMNRLGAYRDAGAPFVRALAPEAVDTMLHAVRDAGIEIMVFVGNRGCIQIHTGRIDTLRPMGPWQNVMDPGFNLHLRRDHIAEVWAVEKPTQRGPAVSVEAFDADGQLILQAFGVGKDGRDSRVEWGRIVEALQGVQTETPA